MFERLKSLFCIHRFVALQKNLFEDGLHVFLYCEKCGKDKKIIIK